MDKSAVPRFFGPRCIMPGIGADV